MADREPSPARSSYQSDTGSSIWHAPRGLERAASRGRLAVRHCWALSILGDSVEMRAAWNAKPRTCGSIAGTPQEQLDRNTAWAIGFAMSPNGCQPLPLPHHNAESLALAAVTLASTMPRGVESACVPRAANGVPPLASAFHSCLTVRWFRWLGRRLRRDAANHTPEARAPHFQLNGYG